MIVGPKIVVRGQHRAHYPRELLMILSLVVHENAGDVLRVIQISHCAERDDHHAVVVVVSALHLVPVNAYHLKADAINADALPKRCFAGEESALRLVADYRNSRALKLIFFTKATSGRHVESANPLVYRKYSSEKKIGVGAGVVLNGRAVLAIENGRDALHHRHFVADVIDVRQFEPHLAARLRSARLQ